VDVVERGEWVGTRQGPRALTSIQQVMSYRLEDGYPVITERSLASFWRKPIGELCAFINGATTEADLAAFGCDWWGRWTTLQKTAPKGLAVGDLGPGSYGGAFHDFPMSDGHSFDQFKHLVEQLTELPELRTHFVSPWIPQYQVRGRAKTPQTTIAPCHGWVHVRVLNNRLDLHMFQRSGDLPLGVPSNMIQYSALQLMLTSLTGHSLGNYYHTISDAHIYENQIEAVQEMLKRSPLPGPTLRLTSAGQAIRDLHAFRPEHFELVDYAPHPGISRIPVAV